MDAMVMVGSATVVRVYEPEASATATRDEGQEAPAVICPPSGMNEHHPRREWTVAERQAVDVAFASSAADEGPSPVATMILFAASVHTMKNVVLEPGRRDEDDAAEEDESAENEHDGRSRPRRKHRE